MSPPGHVRMQPDRQGFIPDNQHVHRGRENFKRCERGDGVQSGSYRVEVVVEPSVVPSLVLAEPPVAPLGAVPVAPAPAPPPTPLVVAPGTVPTEPTPVVASLGQVPNPSHFPLHDKPRSRSRAATQTAYARMDTSVLMPIPQFLPQITLYMYELVQFTSALRDAVSSLRVACDDLHPYLWTKGWEKWLERHVLRAVRPASSQLSSIKSMIADAFAQGSRLQEGRPGPDILQHIIRSLRRDLSRATPAAVIQALQNLVVPAGTPFSAYLSELRLLVGKSALYRSRSPAEPCKLRTKRGLMISLLG